LLDNVYVGGAGGLSYFGTFPPGAPGLGFGGGGTIFHDPESRLVMTAERVVRAGSHVDVVVQGTPGQQIRLIASPTPTFQILASWRGTLLSLPGKGAADVYVGQIPANGVLRTRYDVPHHASAGAASTVFLQAYRTNAVLGPKLAAGTSIVLLR
jgi:hypothetical protein